MLRTNSSSRRIEQRSIGAEQAAAARCGRVIWSIAAEPSHAKGLWQNSIAVGSTPRMPAQHSARLMTTGAVLMIATVALALPANALGVDFRTPGRAAYCDYVPVGETIEGSVTNPRADFYCWTPNDGFYVDMHATGHVSKGYGDQVLHAYGQIDEVLGFGQTWSETGFRCVSRRTGSPAGTKHGTAGGLGVFAATGSSSSS